nr:MAG TPA: hypothetical protein [Caudoviricetes sp.]
MKRLTAISGSPEMFWFKETPLHLADGRCFFYLETISCFYKYYKTRR